MSKKEQAKEPASPTWEELERQLDEPEFDDEGTGAEYGKDGAQ
jgi:hypothetical protein